MDQLDIFGYIMPDFKIKNKIKLIEFFAGVGSQAMSLRDLNIDYEHHKICEWETNAIASYRAIHMSNDDMDYSCLLSKEQLVKILSKMGISSDGKKPMDEKSIRRKPERWLRETYNNIKATHNLVDITNVHAEDLEITDVDKYCYILTYSFPCQDLSKAGKQKGMAKGSGTRSSMLWEVERILGELWQQKKLPQVLLMENVPDVIGTKNIVHFNQWYAKLETIGYQSYYKILNAKDYGIPQNRERCFMISILGAYNYKWPKPIPLKLRLKDMLEDEIDEKYYISESKIKSMFNTSYNSRKLENVMQPDDVSSTLLARDYKDAKCVVVGETDFGNNESLNRIYGTGGICPTLNTMQGGHKEPKIMVVDGIANTVRTSGRGSLDKHCWDILCEPFICASRGRNPDNPKSRKSGEPTKQMIEVNMSGCSNTLTSVQKDNYVIEPTCLNSKMHGKQPSLQDRVYDTNAISTAITTSFMPSILEPSIYQHPRGANKGGHKTICPTITSNSFQENNHLIEPSGLYTNCSSEFDRGELTGLSRCIKAENHDAGVNEGAKIRKLTPLECWRLMGFTDSDYYKAKKVNSNSQLYKQAGNSIVKNVLMSIFSMLTDKKEK